MILYSFEMNEHEFNLKESGLFGSSNECSIINTGSDNTRTMINVIKTLDEIFSLIKRS